MAESVQGQVISFEAENVFAERYVCVEIGTGDNQVDLPSAANEQVIGVIQDVTDAAGEAVPVMVTGVTKVVAGGTFSKGDYLTTVASTGRVQKCPDISSTWTGTAASTEHVIGVALEDAHEAGQVVKMLIRPLVITH